MRTLVLLVWLTIPLLLGAYHYGPGQEQMRLDDASKVLAEADRLATAQKWSAAVKAYDEALTVLPAGRLSDARRIKLERAKCRMFAQQLPEANLALEELADEVQGDKSADSKFVDEVREALANSQYYMTWLMRLEGQLPEEWEPEIESSRQTYRLLAQQAESQGNTEKSQKLCEDLESVIRLARMDINDLQGLNIPSQCQNCKSGQCKNPGKKPGKKPGKGKQEQKEKDNRGAGSGPPPDNSGS